MSDNLVMTQEQYDKYWKWTRQYIDHYCIWRQKPGEDGIPGRVPGTSYSWQFYLRRGLFQHEFLFAVSRMLLYKMYEEYKSFNFQVTGIETASTPMLAGIPLVASLHGLIINAFSVRKNRKEYGLRNYIEGIPNGFPIIMIDDLANSTLSFKKCLDILNQEGRADVLDCVFSIVNKTIKDRVKHDKDKYLPDTFRVVSLYTLEDFGLK